MAANTTDQTTPPPATLNELFKLATRNWREIKSSESKDSSCKTIQPLIKQTIKQFEELWDKVQSLGFFSPNETLDDLGKNELKFMLVPYYLGELTLKTLTKEEEREAIVEAAKRYFEAFLYHCERYGLLTKQDKDILYSEKTTDPYTMRENLRARKARDMEITRQLEAILAKRGDVGENDKEDAEEDELERECAKLNIQRGIGKACAGVELAAKELEILKGMKHMKHTHTAGHDVRSAPPPHMPSPPLRGTRDYVIGPQGLQLGSVPTRADILTNMWREYVPPPTRTPEWAGEQELQMAQEQERRKKLAEEQRQREKRERRAAKYGDSDDEDARDDDEEEVRKKRAWDDWKDDHPRGSGNRKG